MNFGIAYDTIIFKDSSGECSKYEYCVYDFKISDSMKRMEAQASTQTRIIMDIESRVRRMEDNQRASQAGPKYESSREPREWQVPGRPDFMVSQDLSFQYGHAGGGGGGSRGIL